jgi:hypothetical protein
MFNRRRRTTSVGDDADATTPTARGEDDVWRRLSRFRAPLSTPPSTPPDLATHALADAWSDDDSDEDDA